MQAHNAHNELCILVALGISAFSPLDELSSLMHLRHYSTVVWIDGNDWCSLEKSSTRKRSRDLPWNYKWLSLSRCHRGISRLLLPSSFRGMRDVRHVVDRHNELRHCRGSGEKFRLWLGRSRKIDRLRRIWNELRSRNCTSFVCVGKKVQLLRTSNYYEHDWCYQNIDEMLKWMYDEMRNIIRKFT